MRKLWIGALVGVIGLALAATALASGTVQFYKETFTVKKPKASTGSAFDLHSNDPTAPFGQPSPARSVSILFPTGSKIDNKAVSQCKASDIDFQNNPNACPAKSKVGSGSAVVNTGFPPPITTINASITAYNGVKQLILYVVPSGSNPIVIRAKVSGTTRPKLSTTLKPNCIPPGSPTDNPPCGGKEAPISSFKLSIVKKRSFITTPKTCPKSKNWVFTVTLTYRDDPPKTLTSKSPCS